METKSYNRRGGEVGPVSKMMKGVVREQTCMTQGQRHGEGIDYANGRQGGWRGSKGGKLGQL